MQKPKQTKINKPIIKEKKLPEATFRSGALKATIWSNEYENKKYGKTNLYSFSLIRSYKNDENEWKETTSFRKQDVANIQALMNRVLNYLFIDEDEEHDVISSNELDVQEEHIE